VVDGTCGAVGVKYPFQFQILISKCVKYIFQFQISISKFVKYLSEFRAERSVRPFRHHNVQCPSADTWQTIFGGR